MQSCHGMRRFFAANLTTIINANLTARFPTQLALLGTENRNGWLIPTNTSIRAEEDEIRTNAHKSCLSCTESIGSASPVACPIHIPLPLSVPGVQYLYFLEEHGEKIQMRVDMARLKLLPFFRLPQEEPPSLCTEIQVREYGLKPYYRNVAFDGVLPPYEIPLRRKWLGFGDGYR
jgi:hypothetical protein